MLISLGFCDLLFFCWIGYNAKADDFEYISFCRNFIRGSRSNYSTWIYFNLT